MEPGAGFRMPGRVCLLRVDFADGWFELKGARLSTFRKLRVDRVAGLYAVRKIRKFQIQVERPVNAGLKTGPNSG